MYGLAICNISSFPYNPPFPSTFWMTSHSGWIFYPLQRVSTSTTSMADTYLTSVSIFSEVTVPNDPFSYQTVIIKKTLLYIWPKSTSLAQLPATYLGFAAWNLSEQARPSSMSYFCKYLKMIPTSHWLNAKFIFAVHLAYTTVLPPPSESNSSFVPLRLTMSSFFYSFTL